MLERLSYELAPIAVFALIGWLGLRIYARRIRTGKITRQDAPRRPPPSRACKHDPGVDRHFFERLMADAKLKIRQAEEAAAELEREGFEMRAARTLISEAVAKIEDIERRDGHEGYPFLSILVNGARHKAEDAFTHCRYFDRKLGRTVIPEGLREDGGCWSCGP